jgi:hypothetical protein
LRLAAYNRRAALGNPLRKRSLARRRYRMQQPTHPPPETPAPTQPPPAPNPPAEAPPVAPDIDVPAPQPAPAPPQPGPIAPTGSH